MCYHVTMQDLIYSHYTQGHFAIFSFALAFVLLYLCACLCLVVSSKLTLRSSGIAALVVALLSIGLEQMGNSALKEQAADLVALLDDPDTGILSAKEENGDLHVLIGHEEILRTELRTMLGKTQEVKVKVKGAHTISLNRDMVDFLTQNHATIAGKSLEKAIAAR